MRFEEIPKRLEKSERSLDFGFWHSVRQLTNSIGDSSFMGIVITIVTPIILGLLTTLIFTITLLSSGWSGGEGMINFILFGIIGVIFQILIMWSIYAYIGFIAYHQIRYDINRISGIISIIIMLLSTRSLALVFGLFNLGGLGFGG